MQCTPLDAWICRKTGSSSPAVSRQELEAYQLERLRQTVSRARESSPFYRRHLAGVSDLPTSLADLQNLPLTRAEDLRAHGLQFVCVSQSEIARVVTLDTSGTTGTPKRLYFTRSDQELTIDFFQHGMATFTQPGERVMICLPYERPGSVGDLLAQGLRRLGAIPLPYGPVRDFEHALHSLYNARADGLVGAPTHILGMARWQPQIWNERLCSHPLNILLSTDHVPDCIVSALQTAWNSRVFNHYGMTEMGLGGGVECQARRGYHLREADLYFEIIDPTTGHPLPEGQTGEVVFTTLTRSGMPLIRYRTGDLSRFLPGACPCGTHLKSLQRIQYRLEHRLCLPGEARSEQAGPLYLAMADLDEALFSIPHLLNFSAALYRQAGQRTENPNILQIQAVLVPGAGQELLPVIEHSLENIPAIASARHEHLLQTKIAFHNSQTFHNGSLAKRQIMEYKGSPHGRNLEDH